MKLTDTLKACAGVYIITNSINNKQYVGVSVNLQNRLRQHRYLKKRDTVINSAFKKYGLDNFSISPTYLPDYNIPELLEIEEELIAILNTSVPHGYNVLLSGNFPMLGKKHTEESRKKMSESLMGRKCTAETRKKLSEASTGRKHTEETRKKMCEVRKGEKRTDETRKRLSELGKGRKFTEETRRKLSESTRLYWANRKAQKLT